MLCHIQNNPCKKLPKLLNIAKVSKIHQILSHYKNVTHLERKHLLLFLFLLLLNYSTALSALSRLRTLNSVSSREMPLNVLRRTSERVKISPASTMWTFFHSHYYFVSTFCLFLPEKEHPHTHFPSLAPYLSPTTSLSGFFTYSLRYSISDSNTHYPLSLSLSLLLNCIHSLLLPNYMCTHSLSLSR